MNVLFLNNKIINCGVHQYGIRVYDIIKHSTEINYIYYEIDNVNEYNYILETNKDVKYIIYNYHSSTMSWLNIENIYKLGKNIGIIHESPRDIFDIVCDVDPDILDDIETKTYSLPRPIYENVNDIVMSYKYSNEEFKEFINYKEPDNLIIGSFGFGFIDKGFDKIVSFINKQVEKAIIKFIIPVAHFDSLQDETVIKCKNMCNSLNTNNNIKLMFYTSFVTNEELLLFLHSNDVNMFLYDKLSKRSISSCIDYALSVKKPLVISDSKMFKHIYDDIICVYKNSLLTCINYSVDYCKSFLEKYSNKNLIDKFSKIINIEENNIVLDKITFNKPLNITQIISAYYFYENNNPIGDVTETFIDLYNNYLLSPNLYNECFFVNNDIFKDTCINILKTLYVNVLLNGNTYTLTAREHEVFDFKNFINNSQILSCLKQNDNINVVMSQGEIINYYCMHFGISNILNNYNIMNKLPAHMLKEYSYFFQLLSNIHEKKAVDEKMLELLDVYDNTSANTLDINVDKLKLTYNLYKKNKIIKKLIQYFDIFVGSTSNKNSDNSFSCYIFINNEEEIYDKIPEINYWCLNYDRVCFHTKYQKIIEKIFKNPNIYYEPYEIDDVYDKMIYIKTYNLDEKDRELFSFKPITYSSGGKLGDFINQLSVINEMFYETGRKGILYIKELYVIGDMFSTGYKKTFDDTYNLITKQKYIFEYKIYNGEKVDIDLSSWRNNIDFYNNWKVNFNKQYHVDWGKHKWLHSGTDTKWQDIIVINIAPYRFIGKNTISKLKEIITSNTSQVFNFISFDEDSYYYFMNETGIDIPLYKLTSIEEAAVILKSCKFAYLGLSAIQTICNGLHKPHIILISSKVEYNLTNLKSEDDFNNIIDIYFERL